MEIAISFALALFVATVLVPILIRVAPALGLVDVPDGNRKVHRDPIPRCGGLAIALATILPVAFWLRDTTPLFGFFLGAAIIVVFGYFDDRHELNFKWKFLGQLIAVFVFLLGDLEITKTPFFGLGDQVPWLSYPIIALFILGVTNAVNLSDGLDGLAAGSSLLSLAFIGYLGFVAGQPSLVLVTAATSGALLGFLRFNTHPARIFMGDTGSQFLGFVTACMAVLVTQSPALAVSPMLAVLVVGVPILDTLLVMMLRMRDGRSPFMPDNRHLHHQFLAVGLQHYQAVAALYLLNFALLGLCYLIRYESDLLVLLVYLLFSVTTLALIGFLKHSAFARRRRSLVRSERRNMWLRKFDWFYRHGASTLQISVGVAWLVSIGLSVSPVAIAPTYWIGVVVALLVFWLLAGNTQVFSRVLFYATSAYTLFLATYYSSLGGLGPLLDTLLAVVVVLLVLSIRMTRRVDFSLDNQDILVLMLLLSAPLLPLGFGNSEFIDDIVRLAILLYAAEYLVGRTRKLRIAKLFAIAALALTIFKTAV